MQQRMPGLEGGGAFLQEPNRLLVPEEALFSKLSSFWLDIACPLQNKECKDLGVFWNQLRCEWRQELDVDGLLTLNEEVLLGRLVSSLAKTQVPLFVILLWTRKH